MGASPQEINPKPLDKKNPLSLRIDSLKVPEKTRAALVKGQIETVFDLLLHVPKSIVEQCDNPGLLYLEPGRHYVIDGHVIATKLSGFGKKQKLEAVVKDDTGQMKVVFFGPAVRFAEKLLQLDMKVVLAGTPKEFLGRLQMVHPKFITEGSTASPKPLSTYAQISGIASPIFQRVVSLALKNLKNYAMEHVPQELLNRLKMSPISDAFIAIHEPKDGFHHEWDSRQVSTNFRRLAFEELVAFYVRLYRERSHDKICQGVSIEAVETTALSRDFMPFSLTSAQERVVSEIIADLQEHKVMTRLVQGDVGSGKTAVSALIARHVVQASLQASVMAPTEILAEQLFKAYVGFFKHTAHRIARLTASMKSKEKAHVLEAIKQHEVDIVIGTHALLGEQVVFKRLGLVIIDEQHRFGVHQRGELMKAALTRQAFTPHLLVMSATPIPRSLALTMYGDLDLSIIDERPAGRKPIHTQILKGPVLPSMLRLSERIKATGQKAFIVFPLIEESESLDLEYAQKAVTVLQEQFGHESTMLLHGKMKPEEKDKALCLFRDNKISFLVATSVVEVGIDVPDATCMVIVHPERFGLAQLHQLRGRVGRGHDKSYCFLVTTITNPHGSAHKRLNALCDHEDGFKLAEIDLEIRGPGELMGIKQSGLPNFLIFNHLDFADLLEPAKAYAQALVKNGLPLSGDHLSPSGKPLIS